MKPRTINEEEIAAILVRCQKGEQEALASLYKKVAPYLNYVAISIVHSEALSNEVLQDSFIQIWDNALSFNPSRGKPLTWLRAIVKYKAIDKLRVENKHNRLGQSDANDMLDELASPAHYEPEEVLSQDQRSQFIRSQFEYLPPNQSASLNLAYFHGYSRVELASSMGTNINTIKSWLRRGVSSIKVKQGDELLRLL